MYAESVDGGVFDIRSPNFRNSLHLSPPRRQFPLRSKIQTDRIMGIFEGRRDRQETRMKGRRKGGMGKRHPSRFPPPRDRDFIPYDSRRRFCRIGIAESDCRLRGSGRAGSHKIHCCMSGLAALSRCCAVPFSVPGPQISRCQINVICRRAAAAAPITCTLVFIAAALGHLSPAIFCFPRVSHIASSGRNCERN